MREWDVPLPPPCIACGGPAHGSVGVELQCLRTALLAARRSDKESKERLAVFTRRHPHQATER